MPDSKPFTKRKTLIILPELQWRLVRTATCWPMIMLAGAAALVIAGLWIVDAQIDELGLSVPGLTWLSWSMAGLAVVAASVILGQALLFSHRIAGPVYRLQVSMKRIAEGDVAFRVKLRERDFLQDTASQLNEMLDALARRQQDAPAPIAHIQPETEPATPEPLGAAATRA